MRIHPVAASMLLFVAASASPPAHAGVYGDDLAKCLVEKTSDGDKVLLAQWIYTVLSVHPSAASIGAVSAADRTDVAKKAGVVFEALLTDSCREQTTKAVKYEGVEAIGSSFKVLGGIATNTLMSDPAVAAESQNFIQYVDEAKIKAVFEAAQGGG